MPQLPANDTHLELGFRDLIELRFVSAFIEEGLALQTIRACLGTARELVASDHPFATRRFKTDGRRIFLEQMDDLGEGFLIDLKLRQHAFRRIVEPSFVDLDFDADAASRWWLLPKKKTLSCYNWMQE